MPIEQMSSDYTDSSDSNFNTETIEYTQDSYDYFDGIIEKSLKMMSLESQMDRVIDEFIENLKA